MHYIIAGGTGLIGKRLVEHWLRKNHTVTVIGRTEAHIQQVFGARVQIVTWDKLTTNVFREGDAVVNLAGAGIGEKRWTEARKQEVITSRIDTTKKIAERLAELGPHSPPLFNASAMGIYGLQTQLPDQLDTPFDEDSEIDYQHAPDFLSHVAREWEKAAAPAIKHGVRVVFLRFGIVLAKEGGALPPLMKPYYFYIGGPLGTGNQAFCWVNLNDVIRAIDFLMSKPDVSGAFNIVAPSCVQQKYFAEALGRLLERPARIKTPAFALKLAMGEEMAHELLLEGQHVYPKRLLEMGFQFSYPDIESALNNVLRK